MKFNLQYILNWPKIDSNYAEPVFGSILAKFKI